MSRNFNCEKQKESTSQIPSYMHCAKTLTCSNDHTLPFNVDIDCNNTTSNVDRNKTKYDSATIINEEYQSSTNNDIWDMDSKQYSSIDIRSKQDELINQFNQLTLNERDEMSIDLFHLLKAFNAPLIFFDMIMIWVRIYQSNLNTNGNKSLLNREKLSLI